MSSLTVTGLIWCPDYGAAPPVGDVALTTVSRRVFDKLTRRQHPDGVAAVAKTPDLSLASFEPGSPALVVIADGMEKPGNIGAVIRTCDSFGAGFVGSSLGTDLVNPNVIRAAQGSIFATPLASVERAAAVEWATARTTIIAAHPIGAASLWDEDLTGPTTIVIGSEHAGVDPLWLEVGTSVVIPMVGVADSLNASVSAGIFLAEAARQRTG
jgi:TrmH family RNA methyltransferase